MFCFPKKKYKHTYRCRIYYINSSSFEMQGYFQGRGKTNSEASVCWCCSLASKCKWQQLPSFIFPINPCLLPYGHFSKIILHTGLFSKQTDTSIPAVLKHSTNYWVFNRASRDDFEKKKSEKSLTATLKLDINTEQRTQNASVLTYTKS